MEGFHPPFASREERIAYNEAWTRATNEQLAEWQLGKGRATFKCECWQNDCTAEISLSTTDWREVREQANRFAVAPEHVAAGFEAVIVARPTFWLVEKYGEAGNVAEKLA
jgi:hypothetical protein